MCVFSTLWMPSRLLTSPDSATGAMIPETRQSVVSHAGCRMMVVAGADQAACRNVGRARSGGILAVSAVCRGACRMPPWGADLSVILLSLSLSRVPTPVQFVGDEERGQRSAERRLPCC